MYKLHACISCSPHKLICRIARYDAAMLIALFRNNILLDNLEAPYPGEHFPQHLNVMICEDRPVLVEATLFPEFNILTACQQCNILLRALPLSIAILTIFIISILMKLLLKTIAVVAIDHCIITS